MSTTDLSKYNAAGVPKGTGLRLGLVVSEWNPEITGAMRDGAVETLLKHGVTLGNIASSRAGQL